MDRPRAEVRGVLMVMVYIRKRIRDVLVAKRQYKTLIVQRSLYMLPAAIYENPVLFNAMFLVPFSTTRIFCTYFWVQSPARVTSR